MWNENGIQNLTADELKLFAAARREADYTLIDVRQPAEYAQGHIPGSKHIPLGQLDAALPSLTSGQNPEQALVFYCAAGRRSQMAARMALDSGRGASVYNLEGGFNAWHGLALPGAPKLALFGQTPETSAPVDLLLTAIDLEKAAETLYLTLRAAASNPIVCELMDQLAPMEKNHARLVYGFLKEAWRPAERGELADFETLYASLPGKILEGGRSADALAPWIEQAKSGYCLELAELALEIEATAYDLYRNLADQRRDARHRDVFLLLAEQEKSHAKLLMDKLDAFLEAPA